MVKYILERLEYVGDTKEEAEALAGGGGKSGGGQTYEPKPMNTTTSVGNLLDVQPETYTDKDEKKADTVSKKKLGTRGLQIPLEANKSTTTKPATPSTTGVQI